MTGPAVARVGRAYDQIEASGRPELWISLRDRDEALAEAAEIDARTHAGEVLLLAGSTVAVKDNIDVAGLDTTAGCPAYAYRPAVDAVAVARLRAAGAIVIGKTNMDQFATGLVGTRSPYGAVVDARRPEYVAGGSSSGSAVAVALGIADLGLATDTAGSGRVPAAFAGIIGLKPTRGVVPVTGVLPASRSFDCVSVFARELADAELAIALMSGPSDDGTGSRDWPADAPLAAGAGARVAVPSAAWLGQLGLLERSAFALAAERMLSIGAELVEISLEPFLAAGRLLYEGAFVAERYAAVGAFIDAHRGDVDPVVSAIITAARELPAHVLAEDVALLEELKVAAMDELSGAGADALLLPTAPFQPTVAEVAADPIGIGARLGLYTNFCNLLDMCAVAVPAGQAGGGCFGATLFAPAFHDRVVADVGRRFLGEPAGSGAGRAAPGPGVGPAGIELLVVGAHLRGQPLNGQLTSRGARFAGAVRTAPSYRLFALATEPPKPGLVRVETDDPSGAAIAGEIWELPPARLATLLAQLPMPMALGRVVLEGGREVVGFLCEPAALEGALEITECGGWLAHLEGERMISH